MRRALLLMVVALVAVTAVTATSQDDPFGPSPKKQVQRQPAADPFGSSPKKQTTQRKAPADPFGEGATDPFNGGTQGNDDPDPFGPSKAKKSPARKRTPRSAQSNTPAKSTAQRNAAARSQLQKELPVEFVEVPLEDAVAYLADSLEVQMYIDRRALDDAAISTDEPIDMNLRKIPGTMAFDLVLRQVDLTWGLREGVVMITTPEAAEANLVTRVYSVRDLASQQQAPKGAGAMGPMGGLGAGGTEGFGEGAFGGPAGLGGGEGGGMDGGGGFGMGMHPAGPQDEFGQLATVIQSSCKPDSWQAVGGPGVVVPYRGTLVITQTYLVHQQVEDLLSQLREAAQ